MSRTASIAVDERVVLKAEAPAEAGGSMSRMVIFMADDQAVLNIEDTAEAIAGWVQAWIENAEYAGWRIEIRDS